MVTIVFASYDAIWCDMMWLERIFQHGWIVLCEAQAKPSQCQPHGGFGSACISANPEPSRQAAAFRLGISIIGC